MAFIHSDRFPLKILINNDKTLATCDCDFEHKDLVKQCGFRWDPARKKWYMPFEQFRRFYPNIHGRLGLCQVTAHEAFFGAEPEPKIPAHPRLFDALSNLKTEPFPFQVEGINFALSNRYALIGSEMGLGKTLQAIGVLAAFGKPSLVVCPAFLKLNWVAEVTRFYGVPAFALGAGKRIRQAAMEAMEAKIPAVFMLNYEIMEKWPEAFAACKHWVVDEAHAFKNPEAKRTELFHSLVRKHRPETLTLLTGTAITNSVTDFYSLISILDENPHPNGRRLRDDINISSWLRFAEHFTFPREGKFGTKYLGFRRWPELRQYLANKYIRHSVQDHLKDLPPLTRRRFPIEPPKGWQDLDEGMAAALAKMKGEETTFDQAAITSVKRGAATLKAPKTAEIVGSLYEQGEQVVVFSDHVEPCHIIKKEIGTEAAVITGATDMIERQRIVEDFQAGAIKVLVATIGAASTGLTLTAARYCVFNDLPWIPSQYLQAEKRFHRIGQRQACQVLIVTAPGIDHMIARLVLQKALDLTSVLSSGKEQHLEF